MFPTHYFIFKWYSVVYWCFYNITACVLQACGYTTAVIFSIRKNVSPIQETNIYHKR